MQTENLKKFYEEKIFCEGLPLFEDLNPCQIKRLTNSFSYAAFNFRWQVEKLKKSVLKLLSLQS
jgi:hypothetical protein